MINVKLQIFGGLDWKIHNSLKAQRMAWLGNVQRISKDRAMRRFVE